MFHLKNVWDLTWVLDWCRYGELKQWVKVERILSGIAAWVPTMVPDRFTPAGTGSPHDKGD